MLESTAIMLAVVGIAALSLMASVGKRRPVRVRSRTARRTDSRR